MDQVLERLKAGVRRFRADVYPARVEIFARAASEPQRPHTLFITCADSRIDPNEMTSSGTGEVFVTRNIGNMVPVYGEMLGGVSAVIEFAVGALGVQHIVVCGHTKCGAMAALLDPESTAKMPTVKSWLKNAHGARNVAESIHDRGTDPRGLVDILTEQNVLLQIEHLKTHPSVEDALAQGKIAISGWVYNIGTGEVRVAEDGRREFLPVEHP